MDDELCFCGSGRTAVRCHRMPRRARRARRIELEVLGEAHDVAFLFPFMRPKDELIDEFACRLVAEMGSDPRDLSGTEAAGGVAILPAEERSRLLRMFSGRYPGTWASLCRKVGDVPALEAVMVASAVRAAVIDRFAPNPETVAMLEESEVDSPLEAVAFMIQPESVWLYEEAMAAFPGQTRAHVARARGQARRLEAWLPLAAFPRSSELVRRGCHLIRDDDPATRITEMLLLKYKALLEARKDYTTLAN